MLFCTSAWWAAGIDGYLDMSVYITTKPQSLRERHESQNINWVHLDMRKMMSERPKIFKALIRTGIPDAYRGQVCAAPSTPMRQLAHWHHDVGVEASLGSTACVEWQSGQHVLR
jgi:hypothetical protein